MPACSLTRSSIKIVTQGTPVLENPDGSLWLNQFYFIFVGGWIYPHQGRNHNKEQFIFVYKPWDLSHLAGFIGMLF